MLRPLVMLSAAKHLFTPMMTEIKLATSKMCHAERSEASLHAEDN